MTTHHTRPLRPRPLVADRQIVTAVAAVAGLLVFAASLAPVLDIALTVGLPALAVAAWVTRRVARVVRCRREDRDDAITAAAWRAAHPAPVTAGRQEVA